jgi:hypothetical protein
MAEIVISYTIQCDDPTTLLKGVYKAAKALTGFVVDDQKYMVSSVSVDVTMEKTNTPLTEKEINALPDGARIRVHTAKR